MKTEYLRQLSQLVQSQPLSLLEFKEILLRHLVANADNGSQARVSVHLIDTYLQMMCTSGADDAGIFVNRGLTDADGLVYRHSVEDFFRLDFTDGYHHGRHEGEIPTYEVAPLTNWKPPRYWPAVLPKHLTEYPKEVIKQFAAVMGYQKAKTDRAAAEAGGNIQ